VPELKSVGEARLETEELAFVVATIMRIGNLFGFL
jgi:hypothetical protein